MRRQKKGPAYKFLVPLVYAPVLPLSKLLILFLFSSFSVSLVEVLNFFFLFSESCSVMMFSMDFSSIIVAAQASFEGSFVHNCFSWCICSWLLFGVSFSYFFYNAIEGTLTLQ